MKKKVIVALTSLMALTGLVGCATNTSSEPAPTPAPSEEPVIATYAITMPEKVDGAYATVDHTKAAEGEKITLTVVLTDAAYEIVDVKAGDLKLNGVVDKNNDKVVTYSFLMPAKAVTVAINTRVIPPVHKDHKINVVESEHVEFINLEDEADANDTVTFNVAFEAGFDLQEVKIMAGETAVEFTGDTATGYTFVMPDADVTVEVIAVGNYYEVVEDTTEVEIHNSKYTTVDAIDTFNLEDKAIPANMPNFYRAGEEVQFTALRNNDFVVTGYYLNGVELIPDEYTPEEIEAGAEVTYSFIMPIGNANLKAIIEKRVLTLNVVQDDFTARVFTVNEEGVETETNKVSADTPVRIEFTKKTADEYKLDAISYSAKRYGNNTDYKVTNYEIDPQTFSPDASMRYGLKYINENTVEFELPYLQFCSDVTLTPIRKDPIYAPIAGTYKGYEFYNGRVTGGKMDLTIDAYGAITSSKESHAGSLTGIVSEGVYSTEQDLDSWSPKKREIFVDGNILMMPFSAKSSSSYGSYYKDVYVYAKNVEADVTGLIYVDTNSEYWVIELVTGTEGNYTTVGYAYTNNVDKKMIPNVTVEYTAGAHVNEAGAKFTVKKGTEVIETIA